MSAAVERRHWHFTGSVQGVGFRYRAQYAAQLLDLTGWVENNWDGTVDLEAQGSAAQLDRLVPTITGTSHWICLCDRQALKCIEPSEYPRRHGSSTDSSSVLPGRSADCDRMRRKAPSDAGRHGTALHGCG